MDWYPLWNSLRIALISCAAVFFLGIFAAYYIARLPRMVKGVLDVLLTLPMVLPPTVVGYRLHHALTVDKLLRAEDGHIIGVQLLQGERKVVWQAE